MSSIKKLIGQTAIYGSSSIIGRFLNYLLTPLYVIKFSTDQYGIISEMYAYVAFLVVFLTYGMGTALFRFSTSKKYDFNQVYSNTLFSLLTTSTFFILLISLFSQEIANLLKYPEHSEYIIWFGMIVGLDAVSSIPLANLRLKEKAKKFALINFLNVGVNIGLNLFFIVYCKENFDPEIENNNWIINTFYDPEIGVGYVFISNLISSIVKFVALIPEMNLKGRFDFSILLSMLKYAAPMLFVGLAYVINETLDRAMLKEILYNQNLESADLNISENALELAQSENGIYGANYKITMVVSMFIQAFKYASEPFFFKNASNKSSKETLAKVMNYFTIVLVFIFLVMTLYLHVFKYFINNPEYWSGLKVVPILLAANIFLGIYTSLSIWYKLSDKTIFGAYISSIGVIITLTINFIFIPQFGYEASAYATLACYGSMMILSYIFGQKHYSIPYNLWKFFTYIGVGALLFTISLPFDPKVEYTLLAYGYHTLLLIGFLVLVLLIEKPFKKPILTNSNE
ncbi:MAG: oligosaccharide flippase family protein [Flavobacteriales bacterium]|nr:oligosaccharide flippase family protein [Flavobacteriales bacterium]